MALHIQGYGARYVLSTYLVKYIHTEYIYIYPLQLIYVRSLCLGHLITYIYIDVDIRMPNSYIQTRRNRGTGPGLYLLCTTVTSTY